MGFRDDIEAIKEYLPKSPERQTFLFSATVSRSIQQVARSTLDQNHLFINTVTDDSSPVHAHVQQYHTVLPSASQQIPHILRLLAHDQLTNPGKSKIILFLPTTKMTQLVTTFLNELKTVLPAGRYTKILEIHSKRTQDSRTKASNLFRNDKSGSSVLVTSDVSARGVDYPGVTRVIQVGIPGSSEQYVHRVGRTGRAGTAGRGDLVLLPWEIGFVSWQLTEMPLKPLTTNELTSQVRELATKHDADPVAYIQEMKGPSNRSLPFQESPSVALDNMNKDVEALLSKLDEETIHDTFASLIGYYISKSQELRVQKSVIVQGCKDWAMEACGMPVPPYISQAFLERLGYSEGRTKPSRTPARRERSSSQSWLGRGQQRLKGRKDVSSRYGTSEKFQSRDDDGQEDGEYRSGGFGRRDGGFGRRDGGFGRRDGGFERREGGFERRDGGFGRRDGGFERRDDAFERRSGGQYGRQDERAGFRIRR